MIFIAGAANIVKLFSLCTYEVEGDLSVWWTESWWAGDIM